MKKLFKYTIGLAAVILFFASCEKNEPILFQNDESFVAFQGSRGSVSEATNGVPNVIEIKVMAVTLNTTPFTVNFDFSTEDTVNIIRNPALENDAYVLLNDSKTLQFSDGMGYATIRIQTIDDDVFTGNRSFDIKLGTNSAGYNTGAESSLRVTIIDDEHPLNIVLGTYSVVGDGYYGAVNTTIETSAVEGNLTQVSFRLGQLIPGWGVPPQMLVYADVDLAAKTFNIKAGQSFPSFGYGPCRIGGWNIDTEAGLEDGENIRAIFDDNGNITMIDEIGVQITEGANAGLWFDIWTADVVWTKTAKNVIGIEDAPLIPNRVPRSR